MDMINNPKPNKEAFEAVCKALECETLTLHHIGLVFGQAFWELFTLCLMDAKYSMLPKEINKRREEKDVAFHLSHTEPPL